MRGEEDVLDDTGVLLFASSLPQGLVLRAQRQILGKPQPGQLGPSDPSPRHTVLRLASGFGSSGHRVPMRPFTTVPTQLRGKRPSDDGPQWGGITRDGRYLNWKLQDHVDDSFPTASEVEAFGESDSETP